MTAARDFSTRPRARRLTRPETALLLAGLVAGALAAWSAADAWAQHRAAAAPLAQARADSERVRARIRDLQGRGGPGDALAEQAALSADAPPGRVVAAVAELLPGDVRLESVSLAYGAQLQVELRVAARRPASFDVFLDRLQRSPAFADVLPGDEDRTGDMRAVVRARYSGDQP
jgi:hypothetical protein